MNGRNTDVAIRQRLTQRRHSALSLPATMPANREPTGCKGLGHPIRQDNSSDQSNRCLDWAYRRNEVKNNQVIRAARRIREGNSEPIRWPHRGGFVSAGAMDLISGCLRSRLLKATLASSFSRAWAQVVRAVVDWSYDLLSQDEQPPTAGRQACGKSRPPAASMRVFVAATAAAASTVKPPPNMPRAWKNSGRLHQLARSLRQSR